MSWNACERWRINESADIELPWTLLRNASLLVQAGLSMFVIVGLGWGFHRGMLQQAVRGAANMDTLISIGTLAALLSSAWALWAGGQHIYFETGALIAAFILLGRYLEARSRGQASAAIEMLVDLGAKTAHLVGDGGEREGPHRRGTGRRCAAGEARREGPG